MSGKICRLCGDDALMKRAAELIFQKLPDIKIAEQLGLSGHAGRMMVSRHRRACVEAPAKALAAAASKGRAAVEERREKQQAVIEAVSKGDPLSPLDYLTVDSIVGDIKRVDERLEKNAEEASHAGQRLAVSSLSGAQLRAAEVRLKAAGVGGYAAAKTQVAIGVGGAPFQPFVLRMTIGDHVETLVMAPEGAPAFEVHDAQTGQPFDEHNGATIITRGETSKHDLMIVPRGYPTAAPVIDHDATVIEQAPAADDPASGDAELVEGEGEEWLDRIFDAKDRGAAEPVENDGVKLGRLFGAAAPAKASPESA